MKLYPVRSILDIALNRFNLPALLPMSFPGVDDMTSWQDSQIWDMSSHLPDRSSMSVSVPSFTDSAITWITLSRESAIFWIKSDRVSGIRPIPTSSTRYCEIIEISLAWRFARSTVSAPLKIVDITVSYTHLTLPTSSWV